MIDKLVDNLATILIATTANNRYYQARAGGFRSEVEFIREFIEKSENFLTGGKFLFSKQSDQARELPYITISNEEPEKYIQFYKKLSTFPPCGDMFFIQYSTDVRKWKTEELEIKKEDKSRTQTKILKPSYNTLKFNKSDVSFEPSAIDNILALLPDKGKRVCAYKDPSFFDYLRGYSESELAQIYADRFFIDVILNEKANSLSDFDGIWINEDSEYVLIEMKEKDPGPKNRLEDKLVKNEWFFGWDTRRFAWYLYIANTGALNTIYAILEVDNQEDRNPVGWKYMKLDDFSRAAEWLARSGGGGSSETITAPYSKFDDLTKLK